MRIRVFFLLNLSGLVISATGSGNSYGGGNLYSNPVKLDDKKIRKQLAQRYALEMARYEKLISEQIVKNAKDLEDTLGLNNFFNIFAPVSYATDILLFIYSAYFNTAASDLVPADFFRVAGLVIEDATYDSENVLALKELDVSCISNFGKLMKKYNLEDKLKACEVEKDDDDTFSGYVSAGYESNQPRELSKLAMNQKLSLDIADFSTEFSSSLGCVLSSQIASGTQKLSSYFRLYMKAVGARLALCS